MKEIQIRNQKLVAIVDDDDFDFLSKHAWSVYSRNGYHYPVATIDGKRVYMHRLLCGIPGRVVDHINGNTLDNRKRNLRSATVQENARNQHVAAQSNTGIRNVHRQKAGFVARVNGTYLGCFKTTQEAEAAVRLFKITTGDPLLLMKELARLEAENAELKARAAA